MSPRQSVLRLSECESESDLPCLPDDVLEQVIEMISPTELVSVGWFHVNSGFADLIQRRLSKCTSFCVCEDPLWTFLLISTEKQNYILDGGCAGSNPQCDQLVRLLLRRYFCFVKQLTTPVAFLAHVQRLILEEDHGSKRDAPVFPLLEKLTIQIGPHSGVLPMANFFHDIRVAKVMCKPLKEINMDVKIVDIDILCLSALRSMLRYVKFFTDQNTKWNLSIEDHSTLGQGYLGPTELPKHQNKSFVAIVRTVLESIPALNRLSLIDGKKASPYMLVMSGTKRRTIYMHPEFKMCAELIVCYDIGLVAPELVIHEKDTFNQLRIMEVDESHVLYKRDLIQYLKSAPNLEELRIVAPATWSRRVSSCTRGCFSNPDFACFRADGWCCVEQKLPKTRFELIGAGCLNKCPEHVAGGELCA